MQELLYKMVERMLRQRNALSRNRNFEAFNEPRLRNATRIVRHLRALEHDVLRFGIHDLAPHPDGRWRLEIQVGSVNARRVAWLEPRELELLCLRPEIAQALAPWRHTHPTKEEPS